MAGSMQPRRGAAVLARYERAWLRPDVVAGITVAAYLVPQVMAYAQLAGLGPAVGLWSAILPGIAYALIGTSRHLSMGPELTTAVMIAAAIGPLASGDPVRFATLAALLAILVGVVCLAGGLLRLGFLGDLLSHPILVGYMAGVALIMIGSQLDGLTGVPASGDGFVAELRDLLTHLDAVHPPTLALGLAVVVFLIVAHRLWPRLPGPLVAVAGATLIVAVFGLEAQGIAVVGSVPSGLPSLAVPNITVSDVALLAGSALAIAIVGFTDDILTARSFGARNGYSIDANAELFALGTANLGAGLSSGMPVSSSGSRTAIAESVGGHSQLTGLVAVAGVVVTELQSITREGLEEHRQVKVVLDDIETASNDRDGFEAKLKVLMEDVEHHVDKKRVKCFRWCAARSARRCSFVSERCWRETEKRNDSQTGPRSPRSALGKIYGGGISRRESRPCGRYFDAVLGRAYNLLGNT